MINAGDDKKQRFSLVLEFARLPLDDPASNIKLPSEKGRHSHQFVDSSSPWGNMTDKDR